MDRRAAYAVLCILFFVGPFLLAQGEPHESPSYEILVPNYQYDISASSIKDVNFKNLTVFWYRTDQLRPSAQLSAGSFQERYEGGSENVTLDFVKLLDDPSTPTPHAVIDLLWKSCGGSCSNNGLVQVFELRSGHPVVVQQIRYGRHAPGTGASLDLESRILTVTGRSSEPSPNCCPKSLDVMEFAWDGRKFVFKNMKSLALPDTP